MYFMSVCAYICGVMCGCACGGGGGGARVTCSSGSVFMPVGVAYGSACSVGRPGDDDALCGLSSYSPCSSPDPTSWGLPVLRSLLPFSYNNDKQLICSRYLCFFFLSHDSVNTCTRFANLRILHTFYVITYYQPKLLNRQYRSRLLVRQSRCTCRH